MTAVFGFSPGATLGVSFCLRCFAFAASRCGACIFFDFALSCQRLLGFCTDAASFYSFAGGALPAFWICVVRLVICGDNWAERQLPKALLYERQNFRVRWFSTEGVFTHRKVILFDTFEDADPERCVEKYRERERRLLHIGPSFAKDGQRRDNPGGAGYLPHESETAGLPTGSRAKGTLRFYLCRSRGCTFIIYRLSLVENCFHEHTYESAGRLHRVLW